MTSLFPRIFKSGRIGTLVIPNRLVMSPMSTKYCTPDGAPTPRLLAHYRARARGGVGMVITEYAYVDAIASKSSPGQLGVHDDNLIPLLARLADTIKLTGARAAMQISHAGRQRFAGDAAIAPSPVPWQRLGQPGVVAPQEATAQQIADIGDAYGRAALRVKQAGFDLVEVHAGHGYLITQFLSPRTNLRTDRYGGSTNARIRFLLEVVERIRWYVGATFPLSVRVSHSEFVEGGFELDETIELIRHLEAAGVDAIHVSAGVHESTERQISPMYLPERLNVEAARAIRRSTRLPVLVVGAIRSPRVAEEILASGAADFVTLGRALLADPDFAAKARTGRVAEIRPCIRCNDGCLDRPRATLQGTQCSVNFAVGREDEYVGDDELGPASTTRRVVVVGGGPGGMEAARIAARRGHTVTLFEGADALGGWLRIASKPPFKADLRDYLAYLVHQLTILKVDVRVGIQATLEAIASERPDVVVLATGSRETAFDLPWTDSGGWISATKVLSGSTVPGDRVVIVGSDQVAIDTTLHLAGSGRRITLVHEATGFAPTIDEGARHVVARTMAEAGVDVRIGERPIRMSGSSLVTMRQDGGLRQCDADSWIVSLRREPVEDLREPLEVAGQQVIAVGDCVVPRKIHDAVHEAHNAALRI